jgi:hypothetical protein
MGKHDHRLGSIGPGPKAQDRVVGIPANDEDVNGGHEGLVALLLGIVWKPIQRAIRPRNEPIHAGPDKEGGLEHTAFHWRLTFPHKPRSGARECHSNRQPSATPRQLHPVVRRRKGKVHTEVTSTNYATDRGSRAKWADSSSGDNLTS